MQPTMAGRSFASDNAAGIHPEVLEALASANEGHVLAYGDDPHTRRLEERFRELFGDGVRAFPVFNGTAANVLSLQTMLRPYQAAICAETAHVNTDECGAPERLLGSKLLVVPTPDGKLTPELVEGRASGWGDQHRVQPGAVSISQSTELGTVYTLDEVRALAEQAHGLGMRLHMDGARIANAATALGVGLRAATRDQGVDVLSFGGTKGGLLAAEAVVVFDPALAEGFEYVRKQGMQLASKMRFVSAQLLALLEGDLWHRNASHSNAMAQRLRAGIEAGLADGSIQGVAFTQPTQANGVFATLPDGVADRLRTSFKFYDWDAAKNEVRWMCSFDTSENDIDAFLAAIARETSLTAR
jgi:threonine aldolase